MFDIDGVILWLQQNPEWIAWGLFISAFIESFAIIGIFIPGVVLLALIAGMAASADMHIASVLIIVYSASCLADVSSFLIGIKLYKKIDSIWPFKNNPDWLKKGREFFKTYGILGVFVGRFIGPVRPVMPITAGSMGMKFKHFLGVDLFSGLIWAPLYSLPGYFAGKIVFENTDSFYLLLGLSVILILVVLIFKKIFRNRT
jgi:membrane protein DedA with SNARE-associated domain